MKLLSILFSIPFIFSTIFAEIAEDSVALPFSQPESQEIAALEITPLLQQPSFTPETSLTPLPSLPSPKMPWVAVSLSAVFPGLGHVYLDELSTASGLMGTTGLSAGLIANKAIQKNDTAYQTALITFQATSFYSLYAAYRDARMYNGASHYTYQMPTDSLLDLTLAPFKWSVMKKREVWGGILGGLTAGMVLSYFIYSPPEMNILAASSTPTFIALPVGVGEESFFRGFLQSAISEVSSPLAGTIVSSILFGAAHYANAFRMENKMDQLSYHAFTMPFIAGLGAYFGWLTHETHSLQAAVAVHTWYDFILFALSALAKNAEEETASIGKPRTFVFSTSF